MDGEKTRGAGTRKVRRLLSLLGWTVVFIDASDLSGLTVSGHAQGNRS